MEPLTFYEPENDFLHKVKEIAHSNGALLIFDEVISGLDQILAEHKSCMV